jgi:hypothetical protein
VDAALSLLRHSNIDGHQLSVRCSNYSFGLSHSARHGVADPAGTELAFIQPDGSAKDVPRLAAKFEVLISRNLSELLTQLGMEPLLAERTVSNLLQPLVDYQLAQGRLFETFDLQQDAYRLMRNLTPPMPPLSAVEEQKTPECKLPTKSADYLGAKGPNFALEASVGRTFSILAADRTWLMNTEKHAWLTNTEEVVWLTNPEKAGAEQIREVADAPDNRCRTRLLNMEDQPSAHSENGYGWCGGSTSHVNGTMGVMNTSSDRLEHEVIMLNFRLPDPQTTMTTRNGTMGVMNTSSDRLEHEVIMLNFRLPDPQTTMTTRCCDRFAFFDSCEHSQD